uniref:Ig-like domain-containing protein n=1 Tax=Kryptolebias marmoratus TaxID=37003 RepID=A0A3Q2ZHC5_KRYMA
MVDDSKNKLTVLNSMSLKCNHRDVSLAKQNWSRYFFFTYTNVSFLTASLGLFPNRSQFFQYESVSFSMNCGQQGDTSGWRVKRNTSRRTNQDCPSSWDRKSKFYCYFDCLYEADSGVYWCESEAEKCINAINITVTAGALILEIPALPVMEGEAVTLQCRTMMALAETLITEFYKDEVLIGSSSTGNITLHSVTKLDEGLYKCNIPGIGESPKSWLSVRETTKVSWFFVQLSLFI